MRALREELDAADRYAAGRHPGPRPPTPLRQVERLLAKEKADLAPVEARRADFEQRLDEEAARPALIRQRLTEAKLQQEEVATQLQLPPPADEGPATSEARRWALETGSDALSAEIKQLDQELLSQPARLDLLKAKRDKATASVEWVGARVKLLEALVERKRQQEAEQALAAAEATRREAQGKHPLVLGLAERNARLSPRRWCRRRQGRRRWPNRRSRPTSWRAASRPSSRAPGTPSRSAA